MATINDAKEAIYQRFLDNYTGVTADRITFDNEEFDTPTTGNWVRLAVRGTSRAQDTLGKITNRKFRSTAILFIQVFTRTNTGTKDADVLAKEAADIYEGFSFSGVDFQSALQRELGPDGPWYQVVVESEFDFDEIK